MGGIPESQVSSPQEVYDLFRLSLLNSKYYAHQIKTLSRVNFTFEISIAIGAASSGVAGLAFFHTSYGELVWAPLAAVSVILSTVKPILDFGSRLQRATEQWAGYQSNFISLKRLVSDIKRSGSYSEELRSRFEICYDRHEKLSGNDFVAPSRKLLIRLQQEVREEFPAKHFWRPSSTS